MVENDGHFHQDISDLGPKRAAIARALIHKGVTVWSGIPEHILEELHGAGYKVKRRKRFKKV